MVFSYNVKISTLNAYKCKRFFIVVEKSHLKKKETKTNTDTFKWQSSKFSGNSAKHCFAVNCKIKF